MNHEHASAAASPEQVENHSTPMPSDAPAERVSRTATSMVFQGAAMYRLWAGIEAAAGREDAVLIRGESGTGKELAARQVHAMSRRAAGPFVVVDCSSLREPMLSAELFGRVRASEKGMSPISLGALRAAEGGTLYLDEVGDLPPDIQSRLLAAVRDSAVVPIGGTQAGAIDIRVIAATHRALEAMAARGTFDAVFLNWLDASRLDVPALRDRTEDIVPLAEHFLARLSRLYNEPVKSLDADAVRALVKFAWPYNVRELSNVIEHAHAAARGDTIAVTDLPDKVKTGFVKKQKAREASVLPLALLEKNQIVLALRAAGGNQSKAARLLRIQRQRLYRKVQYFGLESLTNSGGRASRGWHGVAEPA